MGAATQLSDFNDRELVCQKESLLARGRYSIILNGKLPSAALWLGERGET